MPENRLPLDALERRLGPQGLLSDPAARLVYSRDASHLLRGRPCAVALPSDGRQVGEVVRWCREHGVPLVARGTGTGLSGGAVPGEGALVLALARLNELGPVDIGAGRVRCGAGVLNDQVSRHAEPSGLHFAPDPSSQSAASIGGNIAENAGGPHCLRHGVTLQHLVGLEWIDAEGAGRTTGRGLSCERGIDLAALLCGSEGTLGVVTAADLKLVANPDSTATLAAFFPRLEDATGAVVALLGDGLLPVACEMIDQAMLGAVEAAFGFGFPTDVAVAMILEFAGPVEETAEDSARARDMLQLRGARDVIVARDDDERERLWLCRKKAFGAVGRLAPSYVTMDVVVPLGALPDLVRAIQEIKARHGVEIATAFHAGDGNLHPGVHYDDRIPESRRSAHAAADEIMHEALARGGSVSGEHGIGIEKLHAAPWQLDDVTLDLLWRVKDAFDPDGLFNPGKALPARDSVCAAPKPPPTGCDFDWSSMTVTATASMRLGELQERALERGLWLPAGLAAPGAAGCGLGGERTIGSLIDHSLLFPSLLAGGPARDFLLELWGETGDGRLLHTGAPVFKNVVGYGLAALACGSGGLLIDPTAATFQLKPAPERLGLWRFARRGFPGAAPVPAPLVDVLRERDAVHGGPLVVVDDPRDGEPVSLTVLAAGRDRRWDLGALGVQLRDEAAKAGWRLEEERSIAFSGWTEFLDLLPDWALESSDWWAAARRPRDERGAVREEADFGAGQVIWQAIPRLRWYPTASEPSRVAEGPDPMKWYLDHCCLAGGATPLPEPDNGLPRNLLRNLKDVFDPDGRRPTPAWLREAHDD